MGIAAIYGTSWQDPFLNRNPGEILRTMPTLANPILATIHRGNTLESFHRGAYAVVNQEGKTISSAGDVERSIFPRSSIKAFQCLAMLESGASMRFGLSSEEIAAACSSHNGEAGHLEMADSMLRKADNQRSDYECGPHWPLWPEASRELVRQGEEPEAIHNNCSGKHAGMLAFARALDAPIRSYTDVNHPVQKAIARCMGAICDWDLEGQTPATDGCSVPTWAMPLRNMALGFSRFCDPDNLHARTILNAVSKHPFQVAGSERFDTTLMSALPRVFVKTGAEGVYGACIAHARIGIALKIDDGGKRASELALAKVLAGLPVWNQEETRVLLEMCSAPLSNWRNTTIGSKEACGEMPT